jgi:hypothetical protein
MSRWIHVILFPFEAIRRVLSGIILSWHLEKCPAGVRDLGAKQLSNAKLTVSIHLHYVYLILIYICLHYFQSNKIIFLSVFVI